MDTFTNGTNLVDLEEKTIACLLLDCGRDTDGVGDGKIITNDLNYQENFRDRPLSLKDTDVPEHCMLG